MTHAFNDILSRRSRRQHRLARAGFVLRRGARWLIPLLLTGAFVVIVGGFAEARLGSGSRFDWPWQWVPRLTGDATRPIAPLTGALLVVFVGGWMTALGLAVVRAALRYGFGPLAVARSVIDEAVRNKVVIVLLALLLIALAAWPYSSTSAPLDVRQPLRYQIQSFLSFSSLATALLLGAVTILFSANSISQDINVRRTGDVFVKPIGRVTYLFGKWLGVVLMMAVVVVAETSVAWGVARLWLGTNNYVLDPADLLAIEQRVLTARAISLPQPERPFIEQATEQLESALRERPDSTRQLLDERGRGMVLANFLIEAQAGFLSVPINESRPYVFKGLRGAKERATDLDARIRANAEMIAARINAASPDGAERVRKEDIRLDTVAPAGALLGLDVQAALLQLRFKVKGINSYKGLSGAMVLKVNGQTLSAPVTFIIDQVQVRDLPATYVNDAGELKVEIQNALPQSTGEMRPIQFDSEEGLAIYYVEGSFAGNLARGAVAHWVRLAFLAMLGLSAGALWSFPVAATFSLSFWLLAAGGTWLQETLSAKVANTGEAVVDTAFNRVAMPLVRGVAGMLSRYSSLEVGNALSDGMHISILALIDHVLWVGVIWLGLVVALGGYLFRRREIARVQV